MTTNTTQKNAEVELPDGFINKMEYTYRVFAYYWKNDKWEFFKRVLRTILALVTVFILGLCILIMWILVPPSMPITLLLWYYQWRNSKKKK